MGRFDFDRAILDDLLRGARRFGPLLDGIIDPRTTDYLRDLLDARQSPLRIYFRTVLPLVMPALIFCLLAGWAAYFGPQWLREELGFAYRPQVDQRDDKTALSGDAKSWAWLRRSDNGRKITVEFAHLALRRGAIAEIRYGIDKDIPDRTFDFPPDPTIPPSALIDSVAVPPSTRFVSVQLRFRDGTISPIHLYSVEADPKNFGQSVMLR